MKTFVFGDVHGYYDELMRALDESGYEDGDRLIGLGDYLDYGPQTKQVLDFICAAKRKNSDSIWIRGNHENVFLRAFLDNSPTEFYSWHESMLGYTTMASYGEHHLRDNNVEDFLRQVFPPEHLDFIEGTELTRDEDMYHFVHMLEFRDGRITIYGHEHESRPIVSYCRIGLAIEGGVAVLDLDTLIIHDSEGRKFTVDKSKLDGTFYRKGKNLEK